MSWVFKNSATGGRLIMIAEDDMMKGEGMLNGQHEHFNTIVVNKSPEPQAVIIDCSLTPFRATSSRTRAASIRTPWSSPNAWNAPTSS